MTNQRLLQAMIAYGALAALACYLLHGRALIAVLILFAYFAVRTLIAHYKPKD